MNGPLRLTVLGTGYLGVTHAACMASLGFEVLGVDTNQQKVDLLNAGHLPIYEPGLREHLRSGLDSGRLAFTTSYPRAAAFGDVHFICAGTPPQPGSDCADLSQVHGCVAALAPLLGRPCLVAGKSTVPVGTARLLAEELAEACEGVELAWNPEFLREGSAVADALTPDRIVVGVTSPWAEEVLQQVYARQIADGTPFFVTDLETAELAKVAANAFLATKISFINAMAEICEAVEGNVHALSQILGADHRIGQAFLRPGLGFGGGCLPKDIRAFIARSAELDGGQALGFLHEVDAINLRRRTRTADLACELVNGNLAGVPMCVLGAAFKPGSDDVRDSPALDVAQILHGMGAQVTVYDPAALPNARRACPELRYAATLAEAARDAHIVLLLTEWPEFAELKPDDLGAVVARRNIVDGRNVLDPALWRAAGWNYRALGVASAPPPSTRFAVSQSPKGKRHGGSASLRWSAHSGGGGGAGPGSRRCQAPRAWLARTAQLKTRVLLGCRCGRCAATPALRSRTRKIAAQPQQRRAAGRPRPQSPWRTPRAEIRPENGSPQFAGGSRLRSCWAEGAVFSPKKARRTARTD